MLLNSHDRICLGSKVTNFAYFDNPFLNEQPLPEHWVTSKVGQQISNQSWHVMSGLAVASQLEKHFTMVVEDDMELCEVEIDTINL